MTSLFTNSEQILSYGESWDDDLLGYAASGSDGVAADASEIVGYFCPSPKNVKSA
jgi:hypothetical protein